MLENMMKESKPEGRILIGPAGWAYKDWAGIVYPEHMKKSVHPVEYLAEYFDVIEINTSFYGHIRPEVGKQWCRRAAAVNADFLFTAKLNKAFTHSPRGILEATSAATINPAEDDERLAKEGLDSIANEGMLGAVLAQFPISFKNTNENREYMEQLISHFGMYPLAIEIRHDSWANQEILDYFAEKGVAFCNIDQPKLGKAVRPSEHVTAGIGYVRLHGRNYNQWFEHEHSSDRYNYLYTTKELSGWTDKVESIAQKAKTTFVVANNHFRGKATVNALQMKNMITSRPVKVPSTLAREYPELQSIAEPDSFQLRA